MKKRFFILSVLLVLVLLFLLYTITMETQATAIAKPALTFDEGQASCKVWVAADTGDKDISVVIRLRRDDEVVALWKDSAYGILNFSATAPAAPGHTYRMTVDVTVAGKRLPKIDMEIVYPSS